MTQADLDKVLALRTKLEADYGDEPDDQLCMIITYLAAAQAAMRLFLRRQGKPK